MKKHLPAIVILFFFTSQLQAQSWHRYAYNDTVQTVMNSPLVIHVLDNDSLNPPGNAPNYVANPVTCDYPFVFGALQSQNGGTLNIMNEDSVIYTPATNFVGDDIFYYAICNSGSTGQMDTAVVHVTVTAVGASINKLYYDNSLINFYPNPAKGKITYEIKGNMLPGSLTLSFFNVLGKEMIAVDVNTSASDIPLGDWASGIYFYQLQSKTGILKTGKIIVEQ